MLSLSHSISVGGKKVRPDFLLRFVVSTCLFPLQPHIGHLFFLAEILIGHFHIFPCNFRRYGSVKREQK
jgi:hypothetical protein